MRYFCGEELIGDYTAAELGLLVFTRHFSKSAQAKSKFLEYWNAGLGRIPDEQVARALKVPIALVRGMRARAHLPSPQPLSKEQYDPPPNFQTKNGKCQP